MSAPTQSPVSSDSFTPVVATPAHATDAPAAACPNCGTPAGRNFCPECGQEQISVRLGLRDLAREFLDDHVGWSTKVPRTIGRLLFRPGALTRDFVEGRRVRHLSPLRLYLSLSVIFFLVVSSPELIARLHPDSGNTVRIGSRTSRTGVAHVGESVAAPKPEDELTPAARAAVADSILASIAREMPDTTKLEGRVKLMFLTRIATFKRLDGEGQKQLFLGGMTHHMPNVMFALLPVFALFVQLVTWRRRRYYAEHFVFALHTHAFAFALFTLLLLVPIPGVGRWLLLAGAVYLVAALRTVYGGSILRNTLKGALVGGMYAIVVTVAATAVAGFVFLYG